MENSAIKAISEGRSIKLLGKQHDEAYCQSMAREAFHIKQAVESLSNQFHFTVFGIWDKIECNVQDLDYRSRIMTNSDYPHN